MYSRALAIYYLFDELMKTSEERIIAPISSVILRSVVLVFRVKL